MIIWNVQISFGSKYKQPKCKGKILRNLNIDGLLDDIVGFIGCERASVVKFLLKKMLIKRDTNQSILGNMT